MKKYLVTIGYVSHGIKSHAFFNLDAENEDQAINKVVGVFKDQMTREDYYIARVFCVELLWINKL